jgi:hypothetical protein
MKKRTMILIIVLSNLLTAISLLFVVPYIKGVNSMEYSEFSLDDVVEYGSFSPDNYIINEKGVIRNASHAVDFAYGVFESVFPDFELSRSMLQVFYDETEDVWMVRNRTPASCQFLGRESQHGGVYVVVFRGNNAEVIGIFGDR